MPTEISTSKRRGRAFKDYIADKGKASLIRDDIRTSIWRVITFLGRLRLGSSRDRAILCRRKKVHHLHLLFPTQRKLTSVPIPPLLLLFPLEYGRPTLLPNIRHHGLGGEQQLRVHRNDGMKTLRKDKKEPTATKLLLPKRNHHGLPLPVHLNSAKTLSLGTWNSDYSKT